MKKDKVKNPAKKGLGVVWKSILITISTIIGVAGIIFLGMYLAGSFTTEPVNPENLFFANKVETQEGTTFVASSGVYNVDGNFEVYVSTSTEGANQNEIELSFPRSQTQQYLTLVESVEGFSSSVKISYAKDANGELKIFASCSADNEGAKYITNGKIIVPRYSKLNTKIDVLVSLAPNNITEKVVEGTKLYNVGGYSQLIATSLANKAINSTSTQINVDVPIEGIEIVGITGDNLNQSTVPGLNETLLGNKINTESLFSAIVEVTPSRAIYKYGKDGTTGEAEYKSVVFALDNDVNNFGTVVSFINSNNQEIENSKSEAGKVFVFNGITTKGQSFATTQKTGSITIYARAFKTAQAQDLAVGNANELYNLMVGGLAVSSNKTFEVQQIAIEGFETTDQFTQSNPLEIEINKENIIFANNSQETNNLGIEITAGQGSAQNNIKNILISIQYLHNGNWFDATKANGAIPQFFEVDSRNVEFSKTIGEKVFNLFAPVNTIPANFSFWKVVALPSSQHLASYGINQVEIKVYYLNPETEELVLDNNAYGPYSASLSVAKVVDPNLSWNESDEIKTNSTLGAGEFNERVFLEGNEDANKIELENLPNLENKNNATFNAIKYFVSSNNANLENYLNVSKYNGTISGVVEKNIYLVNQLDTELIVKNLTESEIEFKLFFAVVEHSFANLIVNENGTFNISKLPTNAFGNLIYAPIKIQQTLNLKTDVSVELGEVVEGENILNPYDDEREFFLQNQSDNIKLTISIKNERAELFFKLAKENKINFENNNNLYVNVNNKLSLENIFAQFLTQPETNKFAFNGTTYEIKEDGVYVEGKDEKDEKVVLTINLSTNSINFGKNDEISTNVELNCEILATNAPNEIKNQTISKEVNIYSGKVLNAYFGTEENEETGLINVSKTFESGVFKINGLSQTSLVEEVDGTYFLNVFVEGFGIDDTYVVESSDPNVVSLSWVDERYQISFVGNGESTLTLKLVYPNSNWAEKQIKINVESNYTTNATYPANSTADNRIIEYDNSLGYQIVGSANETAILLTDLIKVWLNGTTDITNQFAFVPYLDDVAKNYVEINTTNNQMKITKNVGSDLNLTISATSKNLGVSYQIKIVLTSVYEIGGGFADHGAEKPQTSKENVYGIYAEEKSSATEISIKELIYKAETEKWGLGLGENNNLHYSMFNSKGERIEPSEIKNGEVVVGIKFGTIATIYLNGNSINSIEFGAVAGKYVLRVSNEENPTIYDAVKEFVFHVSPNIELGEVESGELNATKDKIVINNSENPVLNGQTVKFNNNKVVLGQTGIEIPVNRIFGNASFNGLVINEEIFGVSELSKTSLNIFYGGKELIVEFWVAPNIVINETNAEKVKYNGKEYLSLFAGMDVSKLEKWFVADGNQIAQTSVAFGNLVLDGKIKSLARLYNLNGKVNLQYGNNEYSVLKTEDGFILTQILVSVGTGTEQQVRAFEVLISPFEWDNFIKYDGLENGKDIKDVLSGTLKTEIQSGENLAFAPNHLAIDLENYINNVLTAKLFISEAGSGIETQIVNTTGFAYLGRDGSGKFSLITQPNAKNYNYRIEFTYTGKAEGLQNAVFVFNYYIEATATQTIEIFYPHLNKGTSLEELNFDNYETLFVTNNKQIVYFDEFVDGQYQIELKSNLKHYNSLSDEFVKVFVSSVEANESLSYNNISYSIYKVFNNGLEVLGGVENFVEVSQNGTITIKKNSSILGIIVKAETPNGAVNYYKILVQNRPTQEVEFNGTAVLNIGGSVVITNGTELSKFSVANANDLKFAVINEKGELQDENNMIYLDENQIVVKPAPNELSAILVIYNENLGTIAEIEVVAENPIKVNFNQSEAVYGDSIADVKDYLTITHSGMNSVNKNNLEYLIVFNEDYNFISYSGEGGEFAVLPISQEKTIEFKVYLWGKTESDLEGTENKDGKRAIVEGAITLTPRITVEEESRECEINADTTNTTISVDNIFEIVGEKTEYENYQFETSLTWDGEGNELIGIGDLLTKVQTGNFVSEENFASWTIYVSHVSSTRTAVLTIRVWKEENGTKVGEEVVGTYEITIKPVITVSITYPDYGTGERFENETIYVGEANATIDLAHDNRVVISKPDGDKTQIIYKTGENASIDINGSVITVNNNGKAVKELTKVEVNICIQIKGIGTGSTDDDTYIKLGTYILILSPVPVLEVEFENGENSLNETISDSEFENNKPIFPVEDGTISVSMKQNTLNFATIPEIRVYGTSKYAKISSIPELKPVSIYVLGDINANRGKLFIISNENFEIDFTNENIVSYDILGTTADGEIAEISEDKLEFKKVGQWFVEITIKDGETETTEIFYVSTSKNLEKQEIQATFYSALKEDGSYKTELSMKDLFGAEASLMSYNFSYEIVKGNEAIVQVNFEKPKAKLSFSYVSNGVEYEIPYSVGADGTSYFNVNDGGISSQNYVLNYEATNVEIINKFGSTVGTLTYQFVLDYKFDESLIKIETNTGYEFGEYESTELKVSTTIELDAKQEYSLISLLKEYLGLTKLNGDEFNSENSQLNFDLGYGKYITNQAFENNKSGIISLIEDRAEPKIVPHGAKNGGDVIHLVLTIKGGSEGNLKTEEFVLRIKINPVAQIVANDFAGEYLIQYKNSKLKLSDSATSDNHLISLDELLSTNNVEHKDLIVSVVSNNSANYVVGNQSNYLDTWFKKDLEDDFSKNFENGFSKVYGLRLKKTVLGGAEIKLLITDSFGYQVTNGSGEPIILTVKYSNESGESVVFDPNNSDSKAFEGDTFEIWGSFEVSGTKFFAKYDSGAWTDYTDQNPMQTKGETTAIIMLDGIPTQDGINLITINEEEINIGKVLTSLTISLAESETLIANKNYWNGRVLNGNTIKFGDSAIFGVENELAGQNFNVTIGYQDGEFEETLSFDIKTTFAQRYKLILKSPFNSEGTVYLPYVNGSVKDGYQPKDIFEVYDLKNENTVESPSAEVSDEEYSKKPTTIMYFNTFFIDGGNGTWSGTYSISDGQGNGSISFDYQLVSEYCYLDLSNATTYLTYGIVMPGSESELTDSNFFEKLSGAVLKDYYGQEFKLVNDEKSNWAISDLAISDDENVYNWGSIGAGLTIEIPVYGDSKNKNVIGVIPVTRSRYEALQIMGGELTEQAGYLPFKVENGTGWGNVVGAVVSGTNGITDSLGGTTSGFFEYVLTATNTPKARIVNTGEYYTIKLNDQEESFTIQVKFMGNSIGEFVIKKTGRAWVVEQNISSLEIDGYLYKTTTDGEISSLYCYGFPEGGTEATVPSSVTTKLNGKDLKIVVLGVGNQNKDDQTKWDEIVNVENYKLITLANGIGAIAPSAFSGCSNLKTLTINGNINSVGEKVFNDCSSVSQIIFGEKVTQISLGFAIPSLKSITINGNIATIANNAFASCSILKNLIIGEGVNSLPENIFSQGNLVNLETIENNSNSTTLNGSPLPDYYDENLNSIKWILKGEPEPTESFKGAGTYVAKVPLTVEFVDYNGALLKSEIVVYGGNATAPENPIRDGYKFDGWGDISFDKIYENTIITARYIELFKVDLSTNGYGEISYNSITKGEVVKDTDGVDKYTANSTITFKITPNSGYHVAKITINGVETIFSQEDCKNSCAIEQIDKNYEVQVEFSKQKFAVTTSAGENGTISDGAEVEWGEALTVTFQPNEGYYVSSIKVDGVKVNDVECTQQNDIKSYTIKNVTSALTISVEYAIKKVTVTTNAGAAGTITETTTIDWGGDLEILATPNAGNYIASISGADDNVITAINEEEQIISLKNIQNNRTISVTFAPVSTEWKLVRENDNLKIEYLGSSTTAIIPAKVNGKSWSGIVTTTENYQALRTITNESTLSTAQALPTISSGNWYSSNSDGKTVSSIEKAGTYASLIQGTTYSDGGFGYYISGGNVYISSLPSLEQNGNSTMLTIPGQVQIGENDVFANVYGLPNRKLYITDIGMEPWSTLGSYSKIVVSDNIKFIGNYVFHNYSGEVILGSGVETLYTSAFNRANVNLTINSNYATIAGYYYVDLGLAETTTRSEWTGTIETLTLGEKTTKDCQEIEKLISKAKTVEIANENTYFTQEDGVLYGNNKTEIYRVERSAVAFTIGDNVTYVSSKCLQHSSVETTVNVGGEDVPLKYKYEVVITLAKDVTDFSIEKIYTDDHYYYVLKDLSGEEILSYFHFGIKAEG